MVLFTNDTEQLRRLSLAGWLLDPTSREIFTSAPFAVLLNTVSVLFGSTFAFVFVASAAIWLIYRAWGVFISPLDVLLTRLGFDKPQPPRLDLASVKADAVALHWASMDDRKAMARYAVHVNGLSIGQISPTDTSFFVHNLAPDHVYIFRITVYSPEDLRATSAPVRVRTKPASSADYYHDTKDATGLHSGPLIKPFKAPETFGVTASAPAMAREMSSGPLSTKRLVQMRRPSPVINLPDVQSSPHEDDEFQSSEETQHQLTERLEEIRRETLEAEKQIQDEEQEATTTKETLSKEREELRAGLREKENVSRDLRKHVSALERENATVQGRRTAQDRQLQHKKAEMQKVKADTQRWAKEAEEMRVSAKDYQTEKERMREANQKEKRVLQEQLDKEAKALKVLEEEVKDLNGQVKKLERDKTGSPGGEAHEQYDLQQEQDAEQERELDDRIAQLDQVYRQILQESEVAKRHFQEAHRQLALQEHNRQFAYFSPSPPQQHQLLRENSMRREAGPSDHFSNPPVLPQRYSSPTEVPFGANLGPIPAGDTFGPNLSPYFNSSNVGPLEAGRPDLGLTTADIERLTGGAPMSPGAGADLLPADLLSIADDEEGSEMLPEALTDPRSGSNEGQLPGLGAFGSANVLPGLGASGVARLDGPASPGSASSRSPSLFASPQVSTSNLAFQSPEGLVDSDRRSIHSGRSIRPASGGNVQPSSRFAQILGLSSFNRQRGKTLADDGLAVGRVQSQSMPKDDALDTGPIAGGRRRNSSHSGNFFGTFRSGFGTSKENDVEGQEEGKSGTVRRRPFMGFGRDGWGSGLSVEQRQDSRPGSEHSLEQPRLSESGSTWSLWQQGDGLGSRVPSGTSQIPTGLQGRSWSTRFPSRRQSGQFGTGSVIAFDIQENEDGESDGGPRTPALAPIGTKPASFIERPGTPKLNPAAQDFKSLFSFKDGKKDKSDRKDKTKGKDTAPSTPDPSAESTSFFRHDDSSPPHSRRSKAASVMTAESSMAELSNTPSLDQMPSQTPSDIPTGSSLSSSVGKGSFVRMLSRKSSGGVFSLPSFQKKSKITGAVNEEVESGSELQVSASGDSLAKSVSPEKEKASSRSWSTVFSSKKGKGKEKDKKADADKTPSISEASITSASDAALEMGGE